MVDLKNGTKSLISNTLSKEHRESKILALQKENERLKKAFKNKRYGLNWLNTLESFESEIENKLPVLQEIPEKEIKSRDKKPTHILIEGDNYHALTCLNYTHKNKIDFIYIDPPYNTGSDGFRYRDKRVLDKYPDGSEVPKDHPFRHNSGVIFISIDINELAQLKLLCDDVFGESNLVSLVTVKVKDPAGLGQQSFVFDVAEYILAYAKNAHTFRAIHQELPADYEILTEQYGSYNKAILNFGKQIFLKEIFRPNIGQEYIKNRDKIFADYNPSGKLVADYEIPKTGLTYVEYKKTRGRSSGNIIKQHFLNDIPNASLSSEGGVYFTNGKKPLKLLQKLLGMFQIKDAVVLDFFAGSGTTGEAVMLQNEEDQLNRQFILVTNNDEVTNGKTQKIMDDNEKQITTVYFREEQDRLRDFVEKERRLPIVFKSPTGSGKTFMTSFFVRELNHLPQWKEDKAFI
ncbi:21696_t:CDS:2 [Gigaspora margarita]|uniref:21696_t:CDS:1 n=1 Tax=Gigaspora margarita TaxID=4874 RepID=A0ABM8VVA0_GIGMA|nr:21696_t:CDS:2 [Gigaspora margarita]